MRYHPDSDYIVIVKGDIAFVKEKGSNRTVGIWKEGEYFSYEENVSLEKKRHERDLCNGKG